MANNWYDHLMPALQELYKSLEQAEKNGDKNAAALNRNFFGSGDLIDLIDDVFRNSDKKSYAAAKKMSGRALKNPNVRILNDIGERLNRLGYAGTSFSWDNNGLHIKAATSTNNPKKASLTVPLPDIKKTSQSVRNKMRVESSLAAYRDDNGNAMLLGPTELYLRTLDDALKNLENDIDKAQQNGKRVNKDSRISKIMRDITKDMTTLTQTASFAIVDDKYDSYTGNSQSREETVRGMLSLRSYLRKVIHDNQLINKQRQYLNKNVDANRQYSDNDIMSSLMDEAWKYIALAQSLGEETANGVFDERTKHGGLSPLAKSVSETFKKEFQDLIQLTNTVGFGSDESKSRKVISMGGNRHGWFGNAFDPTRHIQQGQNATKRTSAAAKSSAGRSASNLRTKSGIQNGYKYSAAEEKLFKVAFVKPEQLQDAWSKTLSDKDFIAYKDSLVKEKYDAIYSGIWEKYANMMSKKNPSQHRYTIAEATERAQKEANKQANAEVNRMIENMRAPSLYDDMSVISEKAHADLMSTRKRSVAFLSDKQYDMLVKKAEAEYINPKNQKYINSNDKYLGANGQSNYVQDFMLKYALGDNADKYKNAQWFHKSDPNFSSAPYWDLLVDEELDEIKNIAGSGYRTSSDVMKQPIWNIMSKHLGLSQDVDQIRLLKSFKPDAIQGIVGGIISSFIERVGDKAAYDTLTDKNNGGMSAYRKIFGYNKKHGLYENDAVFNQMRADGQIGDDFLAQILQTIINSPFDQENGKSRTGLEIDSNGNIRVQDGKILQISDTLKMPDVFEWTKDVKISKRESDAVIRSMNLASAKSGKDLGSLQEYLFGKDGLLAMNSTKNEASRKAIGQIDNAIEFSAKTRETDVTDMLNRGWTMGGNPKGNLITIGKGTGYTINTETDLGNFSDIFYDRALHGGLLPEEYQKTFYATINRIKEQMIQQGVDANDIKTVVDLGSEREIANAYGESAIARFLELPMIEDAKHADQFFGDLYDESPFESDTKALLRALNTDDDANITSNAQNLVMSMFGHAHTKGGTYYTGANTKRIEGSFSPKVLGVSPQEIESLKRGDTKAQNLIRNAYTSEERFRKVFKEARGRFTNDNDYYEALKNAYKNQTGSDWDTTKDKDASHGAGRLLNSIVENAKNGMGVSGMFLRYPSISSRDQKFAKLLIEDSLKGKRMRVGAGLAKSLQADFDGDTINFMLALAKDPKVMDDFEEMVKYDADLSEYLYDSYKATGDMNGLGPNDPLFSAEKLKSASDIRKNALVSNAAKINKDYTGLFSNMSTNLRQAVSNAGLDEMGISKGGAVNKQNYSSSVLTKSIFQTIEQDAISAKKVEDRLSKISKPNGTQQDELNRAIDVLTQYEGISQKLTGSRGQYSQEEFFKDLEGMGLITEENGVKILRSGGSREAIGSLLASGIISVDDLKQMGFSDEQIKTGAIPLSALEKAFQTTDLNLKSYTNNNAKKNLIFGNAGGYGILPNSKGRSVIMSRDFNLTDKLDQYGIIRHYKAVTEAAQRNANKKRIIPSISSGPGGRGPGNGGGLNNLPPSHGASGGRNIPPKKPSTWVSMGTTAYLAAHNPNGFESDNRLMQYLATIQNPNGQSYKDQIMSDLGMDEAEYRKHANMLMNTEFGTLQHAYAESLADYAVNNDMQRKGQIESDALSRYTRIASALGVSSDDMAKNSAAAAMVSEKWAEMLGFNNPNNIVGSEVLLHPRATSALVSHTADDGSQTKYDLHGIADIITAQRDSNGRVVRYMIGDYKNHSKFQLTPDNIRQNLLYQAYIYKMRDQYKNALNGSLSGLSGDDLMNATAKMFGYQVTNNGYQFTDEQGDVHNMSTEQMRRFYDMIRSDAGFGGLIAESDGHGNLRVHEVADYKDIKGKNPYLNDMLLSGKNQTDESDKAFLNQAKIIDSSSIDSFNMAFNSADPQFRQAQEYIGYLQTIANLYKKIAELKKLGLDSTVEEQQLEATQKEADTLKEKINAERDFSDSYKEQIRLQEQSTDIAKAKSGYAINRYEDYAQKDYERAQNAMLQSELRIVDAQRRMNLTSNPTTLKSLQTIVDAEKERYEYLVKQVEEKGKLVGEDKKAESDAKYQLNRDAALAQTGARDGGAGNLWDKFAMGMQNQLKRYFDFTIIYGGLRKLAAKMKEVIQTSMQLNQVATDIRIVTGENKDRVDELMLSYSSLAKELGSTTSAVAQSANAWLRQGYSISEANELIKTSTYLSKLGMIDMSTATKVLTSTLKGFKMEATESLSIVDKLTELDKNYAASAGEIGEALSRVASVAQSVNLDLDKTASMIAIIMDVTQQEAGAVGTSVRSILSRYSNVKSGKFTTLSEDGDEDVDALNDVEKVLRSVGIQVRSSRMEMRAFDDVLGDLADKWGQLSTVEQNAISTAMAGTRQRNAFQALMDNYQRYQEAVETSQNSEGTAMTKWQAQQESVAFSLAQLKTAWEEFSQKVVNSDAIKALYNTAKFFVEALPFILSQVVSLISALNAFRIPKIVSGAKSFLSFRNSTLWKSAAYGVNADGTPRRGFLGGINGSDQTVNAINTNANMLNSTLRQIASNTGGLGTLQQGGQQLSGVDGIVAKYTTKHGFIKKYGANGYQNLAKVITTENSNASDYSNGSWLFGKQIKSYQFNSPEEAQAYALLEQAHKEQVKHQAYVGVAAGLGAGFTGALTSDSNKWGGFINKIAPNSGLGQINNVKSNWDDMLVNGIANGVATGALSAIPGIGPLLGPILGPIIGDGIGGLFKYIRHRDEIERKQRAEEAKKQLEALNKYTGAIDSAVSGLITKDQKDLTADDYATLSAASEAAEKLINDADIGANFKERFEDTLRRLGVAAESAEGALTSLSIGIDTSKILAAIKAAEIAEQAELEYAASEKERYDISEKRKEAEKNLKDAEARKNYSDIQKYQKQIDAYERQLRAFDKKLERSYITVAFHESGVSSMPTDTRNVASLDRLIYQIAKSWTNNPNTNYNAFLSNGALSDVARNEILQELKKQSGFEGIDNSNGAKTLSEMFAGMNTLIAASKTAFGTALDSNALRAMASNSLKDNEIKALAKALGYKNIDKLKPEEVNVITNSVRDMINTMNSATIADYAMQLGLTVERAEELNDKLGWMTGDLISGGIAALKEVFAGWNNVLLDLTDNLSITSDTMDEIIKKYPYLLMNKSGNLDKSSVASNLIGMLVGANAPAVASAAQMQTQAYIQSADRWSAFKQSGTFKNFLNGIVAGKGDSVEDVETIKAQLQDTSITTFAQALNYLFNNSAKQIFSTTQDKLTDAFKTEMENAVGDLGLVDEIQKQMQELLLHTFDLQIKNLESIRDAQNNINDELDKQLELVKAREKLENAQNEKRRVYRAGVGFTYEADQQAINEAQKEVERLETEQEKQNIQYQIDLLQQQRDALSNIEENEKWQAVLDIYNELQVQNGNVTSGFSSITSLMDNVSSISLQTETYMASLQRYFAGSFALEIGKAIEDYNQAEKSKKQGLVDNALNAIDRLNLAKYNSDQAFNAGDILNLERYGIDVAQYSNELESALNALSVLSEKEIEKLGGSDLLKLVKDADKRKELGSANADEFKYNGRTIAQLKQQIGDATGKFSGQRDIYAGYRKNIDYAKGGGALEYDYLKDADTNTLNNGDLEIYKIPNSASDKLDTSKYTQITTQIDGVVDMGNNGKAIKISKRIGDQYIVWSPSFGRWYRYMNGGWSGIYLPGPSNGTVSQELANYMAGVSGYSQILGTSGTAANYMTEAEWKKNKDAGNVKDADNVSETTPPSAFNRPVGGKGGPQIYDVAYAADGSYNTSNGHYFINELGTEGIITPQGTLTALPSHSGIVPADLTRNLYTLGAIAPTLIKRWSDPNNIKLNKQNSVEDNSMNVQNLYATFETDDGFDFEQLLIQARQYVANTKRNHT